MKRIVDAAKANGISAIIASDLSVLNYAKKVQMNVHISTQSNITNIETEIKQINSDIDNHQKLLEDAKNKFLPFINVETEKVNVIYKLKDGKKQRWKNYSIHPNKPEC